jgi:hypothetical protein
MSTNVYLNLESGSGLFYEGKREETFGYERKVNKNPITGADSVSYRKYYNDGIFGYLVGFGIRENEFQDRKVKVLSIVLNNTYEDKTYFITIPLFYQNKSLTNFAIQAIRALPALKEGSAYNLIAYNFIPKGKDRAVTGVTFRNARLSDNAIDLDNKIALLTQSYSKKEGDKIVEEKGDIPAIEFIEKMGDTTVDSTKRDEYLWKVLEDNTISFNSVRTVKTFNSSTEGVDKAVIVENEEAVKQPDVSPSNMSNQAVVDELEDDELPF